MFIALIADKNIGYNVLTVKSGSKQDLLDKIAELFINHFTNIGIGYKKEEILEMMEQKCREFIIVEFDETEKHTEFELIKSDQKYIDFFNNRFEIKNGGQIKSIYFELVVDS